MDKIVVKFGGSNLKTISDIERSAKIVKVYNQHIVVVVSALYGVTNTIAKAMSEALLSPDEAGKIMHNLRLTHFEAADACVTDASEKQSLLETIDTRLTELERLLKGIHYIGAVPDFTHDKILSYGERLAAPLVAAILRSQGIAAREMMPETIGLITDGKYGNATADLAASSPLLKDALSFKETAVVPGFYGIAKDGGCAIFGRGGSDYTAAVIARCVGASSLDLWKDVDGFLSSDPRIVPESHTIPFLSYAEAAELSYFGAKILHPRTVEPLEDMFIPIRVMNVESPAGTIEPFTVVSSHQDKNETKSDVIKSVASSDDVGILRIEGPGVGSRPGILAWAAGRLDAASVNISSVITAQTCINLIFKKDDLAKALAVLKADSIGGVIAVEAIEDCAMVAAVGSGIRDSIGAGSAMLKALADEGINVILAQAGASPVAMYVLVKNRDRENAVRAIHNMMGDETWEK
ncbi:MAG: aspartate kinase [Treponema sp.]|jgi:aspartate kinase/aspartokinase/homoserine dehydrogenase 1|nr:aspartate kinase [Treponema sp.]